MTITNTSIGEIRETISPIRKAEDEKRVADSKKRFLDALALDSVGGLVIAALQVSGLTSSYMYRLKKADPEFSKAWDDAVLFSGQYKGDLAEAKAVELMKGGDSSMTKKFLETFKPGVYGAKKTDIVQVEHSLSPEAQAFFNKAYGNKPTEPTNIPKQDITG